MENTANDLRGTRTRIQDVALALFTEQGYDKTSLREIAERLGVTKAALYYHFKSKEELLESVLADRLDEIDGMIKWLQDRPRTDEVRREFVLRYARTMHDERHRRVMQFMENNQAVVKGMQIGLKMQARFRALIDALVDPNDPLEEQLRVAMSVWALHSSRFVLADAGVTDEERQAAALKVALDLVDRDSRGPSTATR
jgi:AcrR family transcriptional regulator